MVIIITIYEQKYAQTACFLRHNNKPLKVIFNVFRLFLYVNIKNKKNIILIYFKINKTITY